MAKKRKKITRAGRMVRVCIYTPPRMGDPPGGRRAKLKASTQAQQLHNRKLAREKAEDMLAENFDVGDLLVTLTYSEDKYPSSRSAAEGRLKDWRSRVCKAFRAMHKPEPVIFWVTEEKHGDGRLHHHIVIKAPKHCFNILRNCWHFGKVMDIKKLRVDSEKNYESLARYLCKESPDRPGRHQWHISRNASRPDVYTTWVAGDEMVRPPKGSLVLSSGSEHNNQFGASFQYAVYILPLIRKRHVSRKK